MLSYSFYDQTNKYACTYKHYSFNDSTLMCCSGLVFNAVYYVVGNHYKLHKCATTLRFTLSD